MDMHQEAIEIIDKEFIDFLEVAEKFQKNDAIVSFFQGSVKGYARCLSQIGAISLQEYFSVNKCIYCVPEVIILLKRQEAIDAKFPRKFRNEAERKEW